MKAIKYFLIFIVVCGLFGAIGKILFPKPASDNQPAKISVQPSIGATRTEFEKVHRQTNSNNKSNARYDNDGYIVEFLDFKTGNGTGEKSDRAFMLTIQPLAGNNYLQGVNFNDFIPSDAKETSRNQRSDAMATYLTVEGTSAELAKLYPKSEGNFGVAFNYDKSTGAFLGGTIMISIPSKK